MSYFLSVMEILFIDILLSGDNAAIIAMSSRHLPPKQRVLCVRIGVFLALAMRIVSLFLVGSVLSRPGFSVVGGLVLFAVGLSFSPSKKAVALPKDSSADDDKLGFYMVLKKIVITDFVMSIDNVMGIASVAKDDKFLLVFGVVASIPMLLFFSDFLGRLLDKYSFVFWLGVGFIGFVGGRLIMGDILFEKIKYQHLLGWGVSIVAGLLLVAVRYLMMFFIRKEEKK
ncbi:MULTISPECIES: YjbE family putative metal transport protein [Candidatus Ichthyocystis]|uniref:Integral membrane protein, TerC family n=1 Tax=Candidatus Ichthyocystis hellenicum TaxID=1561003 RepID=A0A0S4M168_9BURK|nr:MULTISPECIES: YjbE family putative metal transport protein [Ichthyocystis]CUT17525.1 integral membrane protein, TerC family [Candidatus Ichthyocystis hellenicum]